MLSQFRKQKLYRVFFLYLDQDHNGKFDEKDIKMIVQKKMVHKKYEMKELYESWMKVLNGMLEFIGVERTGVIYFEEWIAAWTKYAENLTVEPTWVKTLWEITFDYFEDSKHNMMTLDSYVGGYIPFGVDKDVMTLSYKMMSQNKPTLDKNEAFKLWKEYYVSDDPKAPGTYFFGKVDF